MSTPNSPSTTVGVMGYQWAIRCPDGKVDVRFNEADAREVTLARNSGSLQCRSCVHSPHIVICRAIGKWEPAENEQSPLSAPAPAPSENDDHTTEASNG